MICVNCGRKIGENDHYCPFCRYDMQAYKEEIAALRRKKRTKTAGLALIILLVLAVGTGVVIAVLKDRKDIGGMSSGQSNQAPTPSAPAAAEKEDSDDDSQPDDDSEKNTEPVAMHFHEEMYGDNGIHVLNYTFRFSHDEKGRIDVVECYDSNDTLTGTVQQEYDSNGNCTKQYSYGVDYGGVYLRYTINSWENGAVVELQYKDNAGDVRREKYENDGNGNHVKIYYYTNEECDMEDSITYDSQGRIISRFRNYPDGELIAEVTYSYDGNSEEPSQEIWKYNDGSLCVNKFKYVYDQYDRLVESTEKSYNVPYASDAEELTDVIYRTYEY